MDTPKLHNIPLQLEPVERPRSAVGKRDALASDTSGLWAAAGGGFGGSTWIADRAAGLFSATRKEDEALAPDEGDERATPAEGSPGRGGNAAAADKDAVEDDFLSGRRLSAFVTGLFEGGSQAAGGDVGAGPVRRSSGGHPRAGAVGDGSAFGGLDFGRGLLLEDGFGFDETGAATPANAGHSGSGGSD